MNSQKVYKNAKHTHTVNIHPYGGEYHIHYTKTLNDPGDSRLLVNDNFIHRDENEAIQDFEFLCALAEVATICNPREISTREMFDLPQEWENSLVDTEKYYQSVGRIWEVTQQGYDLMKAQGRFCQVHNGRYYIAS